MHFPKAVSIPFFILAILILPMIGEGWGDSIYTIQAGSFKVWKNAQKQRLLLEKALEEEATASLFLGKKANHYRLTVEKKGTLEQTENLLARIRPMVPDAFILRSNLRPEEKNKEGKKGERPVILSNKPTPGPEVNRAAFTGVIQELQVVPSETLGLPPGKEIFRLLLLLEETHAVGGQPNILKEKEGGRLALFSEVCPPFLKIGNRISAFAEYKENASGRLYWLVSPHYIPSTVR